MPWDSNDYKTALLIGAIIVVAIIAGIYMVTQWRASQPPLEFKEEQTATAYSTTGIIFSQQLKSRLNANVFYAGDARAQNVQ